jgi:phage shock protein B
MEMNEAIAIPLVVGMLFIGLPWLILHYMTKWKQAKSITLEDENLLDELHDIARRLDDRMHTIERIIAADRAAATLGESRPTDRLPDNRALDARIAELRPQAMKKEY